MITTVIITTDPSVAALALEEPRQPGPPRSARSRVAPGGCAMPMVATYGDEHTPKGKLPPWEVAKAFAMHEVLVATAEKAGQTPVAMIGQRLYDFIASRVHVKGGGHPTGTRSTR